MNVRSEERITLNRKDILLPGLVRMLPKHGKTKVWLCGSVGRKSAAGKDRDTGMGGTEGMPFLEIGKK